jgi:class 3 adenylate cyclase
MFVTFGFAVAQQLNDMKALALAQQVRVTEAYQRFVPSQLLQNLGRDSILDVQLGDQVDVEMSIVFSDIRSFTSISEIMSPSENFAFVNAYLSRMGPIIRARRGYIDKFMGDGVMALFPLSANDAVLAAVEMQRELHSYNEEQDRAGAPRINVGVGINTGRMMLGTLGEADRMEGSVISDAVNLASRLEGLTKRYASKVIISEQTYRHLDTGKFDCRLIDSVVVKGKDRPVRIFEVIDGEPPEVARLKRSSLAQFSEAMSLYKGQKFAEARDLFKAVLSESENDNVARLYVERCEKLLEGGWNPETWDGVERLETK